MTNTFSETFVNRKVYSVPAWVVPHLISLDDDLEVSVFAGTIVNTKVFMSTPAYNDETQIDTHGSRPQVSVAVQSVLNFHADELVDIMVVVVSDDDSAPYGTAETFTVTDVPRPVFSIER